MLSLKAWFQPSSGSVLHLPALALGLALGALALHFRREERVVVVYPGPDTTDKVQYTDAAGACFEYVQTSAKCPAGGAFSAPMQ